MVDIYVEILKINPIIIRFEKIQYMQLSNHKKDTALQYILSSIVINYDTSHTVPLSHNLAHHIAPSLHAHHHHIHQHQRDPTSQCRMTQHPHSPMPPPHLSNCLPNTPLAASSILHRTENTLYRTLYLQVGGNGRSSTKRDHI